ncbi:MAG TPA: matrixin family metalloprotease [Terriglobales bacterium]|nr:matrixin family metalloprotease [Terriglobales bacterium]
MRSTVAALAASALLLLAAALLFHATPAQSYVPSLSASASGPQPSRWNLAAQSVQWNLNKTIKTNIQGTRSVEQVMLDSFAPWTSVPNASLAITEGATTTVSSEAASTATINLICFVCTDADFSKDSSTLAVTLTTAADASSVGRPNPQGGTIQFAGQLMKADIIFNPSVTFNTDGPCASPCQELQTVATHEIGHFVGLSHSPVMRAVMFPANGGATALAYDDVAGVDYLYGPGGPANACASLGCISGTVRNGLGAGVFEAHVFAESTTALQFYPSPIRKSPIGSVTRPDGTYIITGLPADSYVVTAEPLDGPMTASDISAYAPAYGQTTGPTNFTTRQH